ncbi:hypothetical protein D3C76_1492580 [compost metagenome]
MLTPTLGTARQAPADMGLGNQRRTTRQDEILQRPQLFIPHINRRLQALDFTGVQRLILRHRQLTAEVKQPVLTRRQYLDYFLQPRIPGTFCRQSGQ